MADEDRCRAGFGVIAADGSNFPECELRTRGGRKVGTKHSLCFGAVNITPLLLRFASPLVMNLCSFWRHSAARFWGVVTDRVRAAVVVLGFASESLFFVEVRSMWRELGCC